MAAKAKKAEFDPVKQVEDKRASAVIWSTVSLNAAVEAVKKGLPLKANPFLNNDIQLLKPNLVFKRTAEETEDWLHCKNDKVYFGNNCYLKTPKGLVKATMRDYQEDYLHLCERENWTIWLAARQSGKSVSNGIDMLHELLFDVDKAALIVSKSGQAGIDLLDKIKDMYRYLPWHLKAGVTVWNQHRISFDNNSTAWTVAPSTEAGVGDTVNFLLLDEFAWLPMSGEDVKLYLSNILPTISQDESAKVRIMSTQNGHNAFYELWQAAVKKENEYKTFKVDWFQVPQFNKKTNQWEKRTEKWKNKMIKKMGSPEAFYYMYGTQFLSSDDCLASRELLTKLHEREEMFRKLNEEEKELFIATEKCKNSIYIKNDLSLKDFKEKRIAILVDLAEGHGGDSTVYHMFEVNAEEIFEEIGYYRSNTTELDAAALDFWLIAQQLFTEENIICSVELNTYGELWIQYVTYLNDYDFKEEWNWRFSTGLQELDFAIFAGYRKGKSDEDLPGQKQKVNQQFIPGIRWNSNNKPVACQLLKGFLEKDEVRLYDINTIYELESFEDKNGKGHYKASYGHDDIIMTCVQIPKLKETVKWKNFIEEMKENNVVQDIYSQIQNYNNGMPDLYSMIEPPMQDIQRVY